MTVAWKYRALRVPCPQCGAALGHYCIRKDGKRRRSFHMARHVEAKAAPAQRTRNLRAKGYGQDWAKLRARVFAEKGNACTYCGAEAWHIDHRLPKSRGGTDDFDNLVPTCAPCNLDKGDRTVEEWRR